MKRLLPLLSACSLCFVGHLAAADIVALCIGNNAYVTPEDVLDTPVNDARLMHQTLRAVPGVQAADIVLLEDAKRSQITLALRQFKARAEGAKLALIFYSGHGVEDTPTGYDRAETFLLPVDAVIDSADDLPDKAVPLKTVLEALEGTRGAARGVILDCCRSGAPGATKSLARAGKNLSALDESVKKALGGAILPEGTLIAFAASPGRKAAAFLTEADTNSPFTRFISEQMSSQGGDLFSIVNAASRITKQRTEMRQVPHVELRGDASLITDFAIPASSLVKLTTPQAKPVMTEAEIERRVRELAARMVPSLPTARSASTGFTNTLGMTFVPLPGTPVQFCVHETRNADYAAYAEAQSGVDEEWRKEAGIGKEQHPVVYVSYYDAKGFCMWLSAKEGKSYRLPTDSEWSSAVGLENEKGATPSEKSDNGPEDVFPWGNYYPPKAGDGNYGLLNHGSGGIARVKSFKANKLGLYDMGGNVPEWCEDWFVETPINRVLRDASWGGDSDARVYLRSSYRTFADPVHRSILYGFRLVLVVGPGG